MTEMKIIGIKKDEKTGRPIVIVKIILNNKQYMIPINRDFPQCYGKWNAWIIKSGRTVCDNCILKDYCKEVFIRNLIAKYEIEKRRRGIHK